jgi:hypothetical protein
MKLHSLPKQNIQEFLRILLYTSEFVYMVST